MIRDKSNKQIVLKPIRGNLGIAAAYRRKLLTLVEEMTRSYEHWVKHEPKMAQDAVPAKELERTLRDLAKRWQGRFDDASDDLAAYFAKASAGRSDAALRSILRKGGWSVKFKMTGAMRDVLAATLAENVGLIKSIPQEFHTQVQGLVMRSVTAGRDLSGLSDELQKRFDVPRRRAHLISRDQNNKVTANFLRVRYVEIGITEAIWLHSSAGKTPRPTHVKNSGKKYDIREGWYDPAVGRNIHPGELINCRCVAKAVVRGFS